MELPKELFADTDRKAIAIDPGYLSKSYILRRFFVLPGFKLNRTLNAKSLFKFPTERLLWPSSVISSGFFLSGFPLYPAQMACYYRLINRRTILKTRINKRAKFKQALWLMLSLTHQFKLQIYALNTSKNTLI